MLPLTNGCASPPSSRRNVYNVVAVVCGLLRRLGGWREQAMQPLVTILTQRADAWPAVVHFVCATGEEGWLGSVAPAVRHAVLLEESPVAVAMHAGLLDLARRDSAVRGAVFALLTGMLALYVDVGMAQSAVAGLVQAALDCSVPAAIVQTLVDAVLALCVRMHARGDSSLLPLLEPLTRLPITDSGSGGLCARAAALCWLLFNASDTEAPLVLSLMASTPGLACHAFAVQPLLMHAHSTAAASLLQARDAAGSCSDCVHDAATVYPDPIASVLLMGSPDTNAAHAGWLRSLVRKPAVPPQAVFMTCALAVAEDDGVRQRAFDSVQLLLSTWPSCAPSVLPLLLYQLQRYARHKDVHVRFSRPPFTV